MDHEALPNSSLALGSRVLGALDAMRLQPEGAFWLYDPDSSKWKFHVVSSLVDIAGPRWMFVQFNKVLPEIVEGLPADFELYLVSPEEVLADEVRAAARPSQSASSSTSLDFGSEKKNLHIYRIAQPMSSEDMHHARVEFRKKLREASEARVA